MDGLDDSVVTGKCAGCAAYKKELREARKKLTAVEAHLMAQSMARFRDAKASYDVIYRIIHPKGGD